jgi:PhzF family phenazine biosynthesis protein
MRAYKVVDAFTGTPFKGNPVAVVLDGQGLSDEQMQHFAGWTNLSETTFVLPATDAKATYQLRIFTPRTELPFAGHPTLGSAHAMLEAGLATPNTDGYLVQQCKQGLVRIAVRGDGADRKLVLDLPSAKVRELSQTQVDEVESILGAKLDKSSAPAVIHVGPHWLVAQMPTAEDLIKLQPDFGRMAKFERENQITGITLFGKYAEGAGQTDVEVRSFAPSDGIEEDPVCGSGNGSVAVFRKLRKHFDNAQDSFYTAAQGRRLGREGEISVGVYADGRITIGGKCVTCVEGKVSI